MQHIRSLLKREKSHFHKLPAASQQLLKTFALYALINPVLGIFTTAFLWRQTHDFVSIILFYTCVYVLVAPGFYLNGFLLRKYSPRSLAFFSLFARGLMTAILMYLPSITITNILLFGLGIGLSIGIHWANRNVLTLKTTTSANRIYFSGLETIMTTTFEILIPILVGWFIIMGTKTGMYPPLVGYKVTALIMLLLIGMYGISMRRFAETKLETQTLWLRSVTRGWRQFRFLQVILGFLQAGIVILPVLMVMQLLGQEDTLGMVQSGAAILSAFAVYKIAKTIGIKHRLLLLQISIGLILVGSVSFGILFNGVGVLIFYATQALSTPLWWMATSSLNYDLIEKDNDKTLHYAYVSDQEIYLNGGRLIALGVFFGMVQIFSGNTALRYTPLIFAVMQIGMSFLTTSIEKRMRH